ncbi:DUF481 domain-containing protein [Hymenobacter negativus]|uniref:DUF481 domain-containing protein n=1 Tax=Hymenobacter negativus TaxID=2795026 RepID=A0ABS3QA60_9BACT|nr:DUF481 domain-containing protein [Hymenobacter negativus]MBO2008126.1 DUF481 domain-containing protein [Hymenobacter negativus]
MWHSARAQTLAPADTTQSTTARTDTTAVPTVAPAAGGAAGLPSTEFETYNASGRGVRYTASLTGLYTTGTVNRVFLSTSHTANFAFQGGRWRLPLGFNFSYGRQNGLLNEREAALLATPSYQRGRWKGYGLANAERSNLRAINYRVVGGLGAGYQLYGDTLKNEISLSYFLLYEETQYLTELHRQVLRHSARLKTHFTTGPVVLDALVYYQPAVQAPTTDYRVNGNAAATMRLSRRLALTITYTYSLESINVAGRSPVNTNLSAGFTYSTGK